MSGGSSSHQYLLTNPVLKGWVPNAAALGSTDIEFSYAAQITPWTEPRCGIKAISADGLTLTMQDCISALPPAASPPSRWFMSGLPGEIENAFHLLSPTTLGAFYVDRVKAKVYYVPHPHEDMSTANTVLPLLESVLVANGATDLTITGIDFQHTAWGGPDTRCGYVPMQAGWHNVQPECQTIHSLGPVSQAEQDEVQERARANQSNNNQDADTAAHQAAPVPTVSASRATVPPYPFIVGQGGLVGLASQNSTALQPEALISRSGMAQLNMQPDGNLCCWLYDSVKCMHPGCARHQPYCVGLPVVPPAVPAAAGYGAHFRQKCTLEDAIGSHACLLEALACVWPMTFLSGVLFSYRLTL
jgi:hypothetical protein